MLAQRPEPELEPAHLQVEHIEGAKGLPVRIAAPYSI
jgi:hypothetical protein